MDILTVYCGKCGTAIDWDATKSDVSGGNGYMVTCDDCGHVQEYHHNDVIHTPV